MLLSPVQDSLRRVLFRSIDSETVRDIIRRMIISYANTKGGEWVEKLLQGETFEHFPSEIHHIIHRKLVELNDATDLSALHELPGNHLEKLHGDRAGEWSIRINEKWRLCFDWEDDAGATDVEIVDYHDEHHRHHHA